MRVFYITFASIFLNTDTKYFVNTAGIYFHFKKRHIENIFEIKAYVKIKFFFRKIVKTITK